MCLAIFKPAKLEIPEDVLRSGWLSNPGGGGFCYQKKGKVHISKGYMKLQDFLDAYNQAFSRNKNANFLIHFRIPSMGAAGPENTHPFSFAHGALIHNGTIYGTGACNGQGKSDTAFFTELYGDKLTFENVSKLKHSINTALGYNKVAILYNDGRHQILNEAEGLWFDGVWYSNKYSLPPNYRTRVSNG